MTSKINENIILSDDLQTNLFLKNIKNEKFKKNIFDKDVKKIVSSVYLSKKTKIGKMMSTMLWQYYIHRGKLDVNDVIQKYGRDVLVINYKNFQ